MNPRYTYPFSANSRLLEPKSVELDGVFNEDACMAGMSQVLTTKDSEKLFCLDVILNGIMYSTKPEPTVSIVNELTKMHIDHAFSNMIPPGLRIPMLTQTTVFGGYICVQ